VKWIGIALAGRRQGRPREIHRPGRGGREFQLDHLGGRRGAVMNRSRLISSAVRGRKRDGGGLDVLACDMSGVIGLEEPLIHDSTIA
jgi:hypothetical protein